MPAARARHRTTSYFDDNDDLGRTSAPVFLSLTGIPDHIKTMDEHGTKMKMKATSKTLKRLYRQSLSEYTTHAELEGHNLFKRVQEVRKTVNAAQKRKSEELVAERDNGKSWKDLSKEEKKDIRKEVHAIAKGPTGRVHIHDFHNLAHEIFQRWEAAPATGVEHHASKKPHKHSEIPSNAENMYKPDDIRSWCRQATSMLLSVATRHGHDEKLKTNVEKARTLRSDLYHCRQHLKVLRNGGHAP